MRRRTRNLQRQKEKKFWWGLFLRQATCQACRPGCDFRGCGVLQARACMTKTNFQGQAGVACFDEATQLDESVPPVLSSPTAVLKLQPLLYTFLTTSNCCTFLSGGNTNHIATLAIRTRRTRCTTRTRSRLFCGLQLSRSVLRPNFHVRHHDDHHNLSPFLLIIPSSPLMNTE